MMNDRTTQCENASTAAAHTLLTMRRDKRSHNGDNNFIVLTMIWAQYHKPLKKAPWALYQWICVHYNRSFAYFFGAIEDTGHYVLVIVEYQ